MTAYEIIKKYGWVQGQSGSTEVGFCIGGAIRQAHPRAHVLNKWFTKVGNVIDRSCLYFLDIAEWNDAPGRTKREVLSVLKKAGV